MKMSEGFTKAATIVFNSQESLTHHRCGCAALYWSGLRSNPRKYLKAKEGFREVFGRRSVYWFGFPIGGKRMNHRVFALLLMAELAKDIGE